MTTPSTKTISDLLASVSSSSKKDEYDASAIEVQEELEPVRKRPAMLWILERTTADLS